MRIISKFRDYYDIMGWTDEMLRGMECGHCEADTFEYRYVVLEGNDFHSSWPLSFFERTHFIAGILAEAQ